MKVKVNEDCIGCGVCETMCPQVFSLDSGGLSQVVGDPDDCPSDVENAAAECPTGAIEIID